MAPLKEKSELYKTLTDKYEEHKKNISLDVFRECVESAKKADRVEIKYILFQLKYLYDDKDTGIRDINMLSKVIQAFVGDSYKCSFAIAVLEAALEEM